MRYALALLTLTAGCPMSTPSTTPDAGIAVDAGSTPFDSGSPARDSGPEPSETCTEALPAAPEGQDCLVEGSGESRLIGGHLLLEDKVLENGWMLINAAGEIACVGCDCAAQATNAVTISCPGAVVSPGLINTHDHIGFINGRPWVASEHQVDDDQRWRHRHDWRRGRRDHPRISIQGGQANKEAQQLGEIRFALAGATSINGSGGASGFLRNVDRGDLDEGLSDEPVAYETFPLGDSNGYIDDGVCTYPGMGENRLRNAPNKRAFTPHVAEGIDGEAQNEFACMTGADIQGSVDVLGANSALIHGIGLSVDDVDLMALRGMKLIWSPRSNIALYGDTADVPMFLAMGIPVALGTDWVQSGSMNVLRELQCAAQFSDRHWGGALSAKDLWLMVTRDAARAVGLENSLGSLASGQLGDITIMRRQGGGYQSVVQGSSKNVLLTLRAGRPLTGDARLVQALAQDCDTLEVCGETKMVCARAQTGKELSQLQSQGEMLYPLFSCATPQDEPTCEPLRREAERFGDSNAYSGQPSADDQDGDGLSNDADNCPNLFNPIRPMHQGVQPDADQDGIGDACDVCPFAVGEPPCPDSRDRDGDQIGDNEDNCPLVANPEQEDADDDGHGDACDDCPNVANPGASQCPAPETTIAAVRSGEVAQDTAVLIRQAVITAVSASRGFWIAQGSGAGQGIYVYVRGDSPPEWRRGARVDVQATYVEYHDLTELTDAQVTVLPGGPVDVPDAVVVSPADIADGGSQAEALEGVLVTIEDVQIMNPNPDGPDNDYGQIEIFAGLWMDDLMVRNLADGSLFPRQTGVGFTSITGIAHYSFEHRKLLPRDANDLTLAP